MLVRLLRQFGRDSKRVVRFWRNSPEWARASSFTKFLDHPTTHHSRQDFSGRVISLSQRPLPDNTQHSQQTSMLPVGFEPTISAGERPHTNALDRAVPGISEKFTFYHTKTKINVYDIRRLAVYITENTSFFHQKDRRRLNTKIMTVYCKKYTKHITQLCGQKEGCLYYKLNGESS